MRGVWELRFVEIVAVGALLPAYISFALVPIYIFGEQEKGTEKTTGASIGVESVYGR